MCEVLLYRGNLRIVSGRYRGNLKFVAGRGMRAEFESHNKCTGMHTHLFGSQSGHSRVNPLNPARITFGDPAPAWHVHGVQAWQFSILCNHARSHRPI